MRAAALFIGFLAGSARSEPSARIKADRGPEAIDFVLKFPVHSALYLRCPLKIQDIGDGIGQKLNSVPTWHKVESVQDEFECDRFIPAVIAVTQEAKKTNRYPGDVAEEVRAAPDHFKRYAREVTYTQRSKHQNGARYWVILTARSWGVAPSTLNTPPKRTVWLVDLTQKSLKPVNLVAWLTVDDKAASAWSDKNAPGVTDGTVIAAGKDPARIDVSAVTPTYRLDDKQ